MSTVRHDLQVAGLVVFIGILVVATSGIGYLIGDFLDKKLNTSPLLVVICVSLGMTAGFVKVYQIGRRFFKN